MARWRPSKDFSGGGNTSFETASPEPPVAQRRSSVKLKNPGLRPGGSGEPPHIKSEFACPLVHFANFGIGIKTLNDLVMKKGTFVNRQRGSGTRVF